MRFEDWTIGIDLKRGFDLIVIKDEQLTIKWPRCHRDNCEAGMCMGRSKKFCHPHMFEDGMQSIEEISVEVSK